MLSLAPGVLLPSQYGAGSAAAHVSSRAVPDARS
jgi:hypothetical protein